MPRDYTVLFIAGLLLLCAIILFIDAHRRIKRLQKIETYKERYRYLIDELIILRSNMNRPSDNPSFEYLFYKLKYLGIILEQKDELENKIRNDDVSVFMNKEHFKFRNIYSDINQFYNGCEYILISKEENKNA